MRRRDRDPGRREEMEALIDLMLTVVVVIATVALLSVAIGILG